MAADATPSTVKTTYTNGTMNRKIRKAKAPAYPCIQLLNPQTRIQHTRPLAANVELLLQPRALEGQPLARMACRSADPPRRMTG